MVDYEPKINDVLGRHELLASVARGGMGRVWLARLQGARGFQKLVAIKTLLPGTHDQSRLERMLLEEARIASLIQHENVVETLELGEHRGVLYLVMEWVDGDSLKLIFERSETRGGMPRNVSVNLVAQTLRGLHAAHELRDEHGKLLGVVHRDVSLPNVLVTYDGVAKLVDFGIAKAINQCVADTEAGEFKGKVSFMSPEQLLGGQIDRRSDLFAVGIVLYLLTTGRHPFEGDNPGAVLHNILSLDPAQPPSSFIEDYPAELETVVLRALAKEPERRFQTAEEMRVALERALPAELGQVSEAELKGFLARVLSDHAEKKRQALRDARHTPFEGNEHAQGEGSGTLKALSITREEPEAPPKESPLKAHAPPPRPSLRPARRKQLAIAFLGGVAVSLAMVVARGGFWSSTSSASSAPARAESASVAPAAAAASGLTQQPASELPAAPAPITPPAPAASDSAQPAAPASSHETTARQLPARGKPLARTKAQRAKQPAESKGAPATASPTGDLITPY